MLSKDHLLQLIVEEHEGTISTDDAIVLADALQLDPSLVEWRDQIVAELDSEHATAELAARTGPDALAALVAQVNTPRRRPYLVWGAAAAVTGLVAFGAITFNQQPAKIDATQAIQAASGISLQIADQSPITLSERAEQVINGPLPYRTSKGTIDFYQSSSDTKLSEASIKVPVGKDYKVILPDSTVVRLNSMTTLSFSFGGENTRRLVNMEGEGFFQVTKDERSPFVVNFGLGEIVVLGTTFNLNSYNREQPSVGLVEGKVKVAIGDQSQVLKPGNLLQYGADHQINVTEMDQEVTLGWQQGRYVFNNTPMKEVFEIVPRWYAINVIFDNAKVAQERFSGSFDRSRPIQEVLNQLKRMDLIDFYFDQDSTLHIR